MQSIASNKMMNVDLLIGQCKFCNIVSHVCTTLIKCIQYLVISGYKLVGVWLGNIWMIDAHMRVPIDMYIRKFVEYTGATLKYRLWVIQTYGFRHGMIGHGRVSKASRWCVNVHEQCWHLCLRIRCVTSILRMHHAKDLCQSSVHRKYL